MPLHVMTPTTLSRVGIAAGRAYGLHLSSGGDVTMVEIRSSCDNRLFVGLLLRIVRSLRSQNGTVFAA